jgi:hypothetical protein
MKPSEVKRFAALYVRHLKLLKLQKKIEKKIGRKLGKDQGKNGKIGDRPRFYKPISIFYSSLAFRGWPAWPGAARRPSIRPISS